VPVKFHLESICLAVLPQSTNMTMEALSVAVVIFLRAIIMFSHSGKPTGIVIKTAHYINHLDGWKTARKNQNLVTRFSAKSFTIWRPLLHGYSYSCI